jgi:iron-sulfur cluster repair protein YtfE (RIC family)
MAPMTTQMIHDAIQTWEIRELVERFPTLMPVLVDFGFDLCCGGEHTLAEAANLHGLSIDEVLGAVAGALGEESR